MVTVIYHQQIMGCCSSESSKPNSVYPTETAAYNKRETGSESPRQNAQVYPTELAPVAYPKRETGPKFIPDNYRTLEEVQEALRKEGLESSNLIFGVDYTGSNHSTVCFFLFFVPTFDFDFHTREDYHSVGVRCMISQSKTHTKK
jgi:hypothetical protein